MKKTIIILSLMLISCNFSQDKESNSNKSSSSKLYGIIDNLKDSLTVVLYKMDTHNFYGKGIDSTLSLNGSFELKIENKEPSEYMIMILDYKNKIAKRNYFWQDKGNISIIGNYNDFEYAEINGSKLVELSKRYIAIVEKYSNQMKNGEIELKDFHKGVKKDQLNFLFENPNNAVSLSNILSYTNRLSKDSLQIFYSKLDNQLQNSKNGIALKNSFKIDKIKVGETFIDILAKDLEGNNVKLSDFKGKVIVLDFWANWCHYCHEQNQEEFPRLKKKYKNEDFVIISYSIDVDKKDWEKSSKADKINWINISNLDGVSDKYVTQYGVQGYPTSFIIDKEGTVLKQINGYVYDALEKELDKIFNLK